MKNKSIIFATYKPSTNLHNVIRGSYFYGYIQAFICKDIRLSIHDWLLRLRCNLYLAVRGAIAFLICNILIFHYMPSTMKDYSDTNNSNINVTHDCESVNAVNTVLSQRSIKSIEYLLHHFWNNFEHDCFTDKIMYMLSVYTKYCPEDVHTFKKPDWMIKFVSELIQLNDWLRDIMNDECVWEWENTSDGWKLPNNP